MERHHLRLLIGGLTVLSLLLSCKKEEKSPTGPGDGPDVPAGYARLTGTVRDAAGTPVSDVFLHIIYPVGTTTTEQAHPMTPSSVLFYNDSQTLTTECGGSTSLPEGVIIKLFWDRDGDGVDNEDPPPPLCDNPPNCEGSPAGTVNFIEMPINGPTIGLGEGQFMANLFFTTVGDVLTPNRFYARIYCADGNVLWTSQVVDVPAGPSERELVFTCTPCDGAPVIPSWNLEQSYPNPAADSVTIRFGLQDVAQSKITLRWPNNRYSETLLDSVYGSGGQQLKLNLGDRPNGLYTVHYTAGTYSNEHMLLRNVNDYNTLRGMEEFALSGSEGTYTFDAAAGQSLRLRSADGADQGTLILTRLTVVAIKNGYQIADSTLDIAATQEYAVDLVLQPE
ncbi:MAG: hypothetical protein ACOZB3_08485 [Calditrichota bacterium]